MWPSQYAGEVFDTIAPGTESAARGDIELFRMMLNESSRGKATSAPTKYEVDEKRVWAAVTRRATRQTLFVNKRTGMVHKTKRSKPVGHIRSRDLLENHIVDGWVS